MSIKKKMGTGILAGALGLSLVGGGTFAAFNDVETVDNTFAAGTLDLVTNTKTIFNVSNLKPGDYFEKTLELSNNGTLDIDEILLSSETSGWEDVKHGNLTDNGENSELEFLSQFKVTITQGEATVYTGNLSDFQSQSNVHITPEGAGVAALQPEQSVAYTVKVEFVNVDETYEGSRLQKQNKFQGEGADLALTFEATQMPGEDRSNDAIEIVEPQPE